MNHPSPTHRVAIVGAGNVVTQAHLPALMTMADRVSLVGITDLDADRAGAAAAEFGIAAAYPDVATMLARAEPDLVHVCTPPGAHAEAVIACLDAGVDVWCEKPPTLSLAEYDEIARHEGADGPYVSYVFQQRFGSAAVQLREQIRTEALGRPLVGVCNTLWFRGHDYFEVPWRRSWATAGGGPTLGLGIHQLDLLVSLLGDWREVQAITATLDRAIEVEDVSLAMITFESGALVSVINSALSPREESYLRFDFTDATVEVSHLYGYGNADWTWTPAPHVADPLRIASWAPATDIRSSHEAQLAIVLDALDAGERPPASGADGRRSMELITAIYQSAAERRPVTRDSLTPGNPYYTGFHPDAIE